MVETKNGIRHMILLNKHLRNGCLFGTKPKTGDSHFWSSIMKIKYTFYQYCKKVGNGKNARFLGRLLVDYKPLKSLMLYCII